MAVGLFLPVNPKGSYLEPKGELAAGPATELPFAPYRITAGDYLGLRCVGSFSAGQNWPNECGLAACFFGLGVGGPVAPARYGQELPAQTPPTWPLGTSTEIPEDFYVPQDRVVIVRVPNGATRLLFTVPDSYFADNSDSDGDFGVLVTCPNRPLAVPAPPARRWHNSRRSASSARAEPPEYTEADKRALTTALAEASRAAPEWPEARTFAASPFDLNADQATRAQYRGWYVNTNWNPANSHFNPDGINGRRHYGVDVFAPRGSNLIAPVGPCRVDLLPNVSGYGNTVAFRFKQAGEKYTAIYAHCDSFFLDSGRVASAGEIVATAGCSGNSSAEQCGIDLPSGGRTDHVHLGLYRGEIISDSSGEPVDPAALFGWSPVEPS